MTLNLRYENTYDKENGWDKRRDEVARMINFYQPDLLGIQEGLYAQVHFLDSALPHYDYIGVGREDGKQQGEYAAIFYNTKKLTCLNQKTYWLSETPDKVSKGWDAALERIVTFGTFVAKGKKDTFYVFNCHMDHIGKTAREQSARFILHLIDSMCLAKSKVVLTGDMNAEPDEAPLQVFKTRFDDLYQTPSIQHYGPPGTFNNFKTDQPVTKRIDYIFVKNIPVYSYIHIDDRRDNTLWLSDHLPVLARCTR